MSVLPARQAHAGADILRVRRNKPGYGALYRCAAPIHDAVTPTEEGHHVSFQPFDYASKQRIETTEAVTKELFVVEAGVAIFNFRGDGGEWLRDQLDIPTDTVMMRPSVGGGPGSLVTFHGPRVVATASLASISNNNEAINAGWAVDACWWDQDASGRIVLHVNLAVRDGDGFLDRIAYHMTAIGFPVFEVGIHHGS